jgi:hypothetical protein
MKADGRRHFSTPLVHNPHYNIAQNTDEDLHDICHEYELRFIGLVRVNQGQPCLFQYPKESIS